MSVIHIEVGNVSSAALAQEIDACLAQIHSLIQEKKLKRQVNYELLPKRSRHKHRLKSTRIKAPDPDTLRHLNQNKRQWCEDPSSFWSHDTAVGLAHVAPNSAFEKVVSECLLLSLHDAHSHILRRYLCIVLAQIRDEQPMIDIEKIGESFVNAEDPIEGGKAVDKLVKAGDKYRLIQAALGEGCLFLLECDMGKYFWEVTLPKSGKRFEDYMTYGKSIGLMKAAEEFKDLHAKVFGHKMSEVRAYQRNASASTNREKFATPEIAQNTMLHATQGDQGVRANDPVEAFSPDPAVGDLSAGLTQDRRGQVSDTNVVDFFNGLCDPNVADLFDNPMHDPAVEDLFNRQNWEGCDHWDMSYC